MHGCDSMHEFVLSITSHAYTHFVHYSIIYPYVETKDEETMTTNDQSGHSRRAVKKCLANLLPSYEVRSLVAELINRTFSLLLTFGRQWSCHTIIGRLQTKSYETGEAADNIQVSPARLHLL